MLETQRLAGDLDLDREGVGEAGQGPERSAQQIAQLILAGQPHGIGEGDGVECPLGRAVEGEVYTARRLARLDRHPADREDVGLGFEFDLVRKIELKAVALGRVPHEPGVAQGYGQFSGDHRSTLDDPGRGRTRLRLWRGGLAVSEVWGRVET